MSLLSMLMVMRTLGGRWEGIDKFEGTVLGLGKVERHFTAEIFIHGDIIQGVGEDESGSFRFDGSLDNFYKIYDEEWCDSIRYNSLNVDQNWINGTYW